MKRSSIVRKSISRLVLLGVIILAGICLVASVTFYNKLLEDNTELAYSFAKIAGMRISGDLLNQFAEDPDGMYQYLEEINRRQDGINLGSTEIPDIPGYPNEIKDLAREWLQVHILLLQTVALNSNLTSAEVISPEDDNALVFWYLNKGGGEITPMMSRDYEDGEKEFLDHIQAAFDDDEVEYRERLLLSTDDGDPIGTAVFPIIDNRGQIVAYAEVDVSLAGIRTSIVRLIVNIAILLTIIMAATLFIYYILLRKTIIRPILQLQAAASGVVDRLADKSVTPVYTGIRSDDEIGELSRSFEEMGQGLRAYIDENNAINAEKEHILAELELASRIQSDMLPGSFPAFPDRTDFDIYASMDPAKEVGGDFYDFFLIDEDTLALVIADVSGKGIPAALFMMRTMIMIQNVAAKSTGPVDILEHINRQICLNNNSAMFVTVWLGILDLKTGLLKAANAGHEYPVLKKPGEDFELFKDRHGLVIGGRMKSSYREYELQLEPGTLLFLYTDGLPEAKNPSGEMFRTSGLLDALHGISGSSPEEILKEMRSSVADFVKDAEQFDDLTMMCLQYRGK